MKDAVFGIARLFGAVASVDNERIKTPEIPHGFKPARILMISRLCALVVVLVISAAGILWGREAEPSGLSRRPNVLFLVIDDLAATRMGIYGDAKALTPNLDDLGRRGLVFDHAYCQQALCAPSRASVMTGHRPETFPETMAGSQTAHYRETLPNVVTLPQAFKLAGYHTESIGKVNHVYPPLLDPPSWSVPERLADIPKRDEYLLPKNRVGGFINPMVKGESAERIEAPDSAYQDGQVADAAIEALGRLKDSPFFLAVGFKRPHLPWSAPEKYWAMHDGKKFIDPEPMEIAADEMEKFPWRFEWHPDSGELRGYVDIPRRGKFDAAKAAQLRHGYYAAVSYVDAQVGRVREALLNLKLADNTIVVIWGDNGYHLGDAGQWGKKRNTEATTRVPLMMIVPGETRPGTRSDALVELVDLFPTLVELAGLHPPAGLEGKSLVPLLSNPGRSWKEATFSVSQRGKVAGYSVRSKAYRYTEWKRDGAVVDRELYADGAVEIEANNLASVPRAGPVLKQMQALLHAGWKANNSAVSLSR